jgi:hypothetical protein
MRLQGLEGDITFVLLVEQRIAPPSNIQDRPERIPIPMKKTTWQQMFSTNNS